MRAGRGSARPGVLATGAAVLLVLGSLLTGCRSTAGAEEAFVDASGVASADDSCAKGHCIVTVEMEQGASTEEVVEALRRARELDADELTVELTSPTGEKPVGISLSDDAPETWDTEVAEAMRAYRRHPSVEAAEAHLGSDGVSLRLRTGAGPEAWDVAEELWSEGGGLGDGAFELTGSFDAVTRTLVATGGFPTDQVAVAKALEAELGERLTGLALHPGTTYVGVLDARLPDRVREVAAAVPGAGEAATAVLVTDELHELARSAERDPEHQLADHTDLLAELQAVPRVRRAVQGWDVVRVRLASPVLDGAEAVFRTVRTHPSPPGFVEVAATGSADVRVRLAADADPALADLAHLAALGHGGGGSSSRLEVLELSADDDEPFLTVAVRAPALAPELARLARVVAGWHARGAAVPTLGISVDATDAEGRGASTSWTVDLTTSPPSVVEVQGTPEAEAELRAAWAEGVRGP